MEIEGFKNPYKEGCPVFQEDFVDPNIGKAAAFEAGAEEYKRCLCTDENTCEKYEVPTALNPNNKRGYLVFIEEG